MGCFTFFAEMLSWLMRQCKKVQVNLKGGKHVEHPRCQMQELVSLDDDLLDWTAVVFRGQDQRYCDFFAHPCTNMENLQVGKYSEQFWKWTKFSSSVSKELQYKIFRGRVKVWKWSLPKKNLTSQLIYECLKKHFLLSTVLNFLMSGFLYWLIIYWVSINNWSFKEPIPKPYNPRQLVKMLKEDIK